MTSLPQSTMDFYKEKFRAFIIEIYKRQIRAELIAEQDLPKGASIFYEPPKSF